MTDWRAQQGFEVGLSQGYKAFQDYRQSKIAQSENHKIFKIHLAEMQESTSLQSLELQNPYNTRGGKKSSMTLDPHVCY